MWIFLCGILACGHSDPNQQPKGSRQVHMATPDDDNESLKDNLLEDSTFEKNTNDEDATSSVENDDNNTTHNVEHSSANSSTKKALIIGLGQQKDKSWSKINGDKDIPYVKEMLSYYGYDDIRVLVNQQATKVGIVSAFKTLANDCKKGDVVYVHFSGHGQQVTDVNGDENDGWDEAWIPYDAYLEYGDNDKGEKHLIDDEIYVLLSSIMDKIGDDGKLLVVVDACHSGGSTRGRKEIDVVRGVFDEFVIPDVKSTKSSRLPEKWLTLSACKNYQINQEMPNRPVGKLTYALYVVSKGNKVSLDELTHFMEQHRSRLPQTPELTGKENTRYNITDFFKE